MGMTDCQAATDTGLVPDVARTVNVVRAQASWFEKRIIVLAYAGKNRYFLASIVN
jgi:hypothetical protein